MGLFGNRHGKIESRLLGLETEILELRKQLRAALSEVAEVSATAYRHMKAAQARARRGLDESGGANQGRAAPTVMLATPSPSPRMWGARARRMSRPDPVAEIEPDEVTENGIHP